ncbi:MAG: YlxM family DNA-binding protein [Clostridia bacterium]|nr:YlxM family DNA-binding protein [Clostridia bacterium]
MDKIYEISLLLDFYGQLLTARQYEILDLHYNNDYSLGEIAEQLNISRQGVFDNEKRGKTILNDLEQKLGLVKKFYEQKEKMEEILNIIASIDINNLSNENKEKFKKVENGIIEIINKI